MKKAVILGIAAVLAVFVAVCGAGCIGGDPIVGEWEGANGTIPVVFNDDGTGSFTITIPFLGAKDYQLTWTKVEGYDNQYTISTTENAIPVGTYIISDDGKTLKGPITLTKVVE